MQIFFSQDYLSIIDVEWAEQKGDIDDIGDAGKHPGVIIDLMPPLMDRGLEDLEPIIHSLHLIAVFVQQFVEFLLLFC